MRSLRENGGRTGSKWRGRYDRAMEALRLFGRVDGQQLIEICAGHRSIIIEEAYANKNKRLAYAMLSGFPCRDESRRADRKAREMIRKRKTKRYFDMNESGSSSFVDESDSAIEDESLLLKRNED